MANLSVTKIYVRYSLDIIQPVYINFMSVKWYILFWYNLLQDMKGFYWWTHLELEITERFTVQKTDLILHSEIFEC